VTVTDIRGPDDSGGDAEFYERYLRDHEDTDAFYRSAADSFRDDPAQGPYIVTIPLREARPREARQTPLNISDEEVRQNFRLALKRLGDSDERRARWLLRFAAADLSKLSSGQRLDLKWEILAFVEPPFSDFLHVEAVAGEIQLPDDSPHTWLQNGIKELRDGPSVVILGEDTPPSWSLSIQTSWKLVRVKDRVIVDSPRGAPSTSARFEAEVLRVLSSQAHRFRFCRNCSQPFIARKRQAYCAPKCSQTFRTRKYRAKDPEQQRTKRRAAYENALKQKLGPRVRVRRRASRPQQAGADGATEGVG
jgi:hypothetical protein